MRIRIIVLLASLLGTTAARAAETPAPSPTVDAEVQRHATLGQRFLERGDGQRAVGEFRRAYELRADARFLFDIAEAYERVGLDDQARFFYDRYLHAAPDALDREEVEERLAAIDKRTASGTKPPNRVPPAAPAAPSAPTPALSFGHDVVVVPVAEPPPPRPLWKRWWVWASVGALVAGAAGGVYALERGQTAAPATALGDKTFY
jgi:tetratricopeptide (TPR) repeat protein